MARRRGPGLGELFTFGGRVPATVGVILASMVIATLASGLTGHRVGALLLLDPRRIGQLELWRIATWFLVSRDPLTLLFAGFELWWIGQQLSYEWSERRFAWRFLTIIVGAGVLTFLVAQVWPAADVPHTGPWPVANAVFFTWALLHPGAEVRVFGVVPMNGRLLAQATVIGTLLWGIFSAGLAGVGAFVPHLSALLVAWVELRRGAGMRRSWLRARQGFTEWQLRRRAKHLRVVKKNGAGGRPPWVN